MSVERWEAFPCKLRKLCLRCLQDIIYCFLYLYHILLWAHVLRSGLVMGYTTSYSPWHWSLVCHHPFTPGWLPQKPPEMSYTDLCTMPSANSALFTGHINFLPYSWGPFTSNTRSALWQKNYFGTLNFQCVVNWPFPFSLWTDNVNRQGKPM